MDVTMSDALQAGPKLLRDASSSASRRHALSVLAEVTFTTVVLFDENQQVDIGPVAGNAFGTLLLETGEGQKLVIEAHRAAISASSEADPAAPRSAYGFNGLDHFAVPLMIGQRRVGTLTLGDRPRRPLPPTELGELAQRAGIEPARLEQAASALPIWSAQQAARARDLAALIGELLSELGARENDLQRRIDELSAMYNITGLVAGAEKLSDALPKVASLICQVMHVKSCSIRLLDEQSGTLIISGVHNLSPEYLAKGPVTVDDNPIDAAALRGELVRVLDAPNDPRTRYRMQAQKEGIVSGLVCGMIYRGEKVGVLRVYTGETHTFTPFQESLLQAVASQLAAAILNIRLVAEAVDAERYARQLAYAGAVQRRMIPETPPAYGNIDLGTVYRPSFDVGGDFYDFITLQKKNLGLAIADVSGKGVPASLQMASLRAALRVNAYHMYDIDRILVEVNRHMCRDACSGEFATMFYGVLNGRTGRLTYCNAGHNPPMLLREGRIEYLLTGGGVLGIEADATFERGILDLNPGDLLLLYTDGTVEALNFEDQRFGTQRLADSLKQNAEQPAQRIAHNLLWDIRRFRGLADRTDDLTMVVMKVTGPFTTK